MKIEWGIRNKQTNVKQCIHIDNDDDVAKATTCHELLCIRDGIANAPVNFDQCNELLNELCTS